MVNVLTNIDISLKNTYNQVWTYFQTFGLTHNYIFIKIIMEKSSFDVKLFTFLVIVSNKSKHDSNNGIFNNWRKDLIVIYPFFLYVPLVYQPSLISRGIALISSLLNFIHPLVAHYKFILWFPN